MERAEEFCIMLHESGEFDELEIRIIRALLILEGRKKNRFDAATIAKEAGISVTNAYKYLYSLQEKGLVESVTGRAKMFWLTKSTNPFPRIFSYVGKEYLRQKEIFAKLGTLYERLLPDGKIWDGERVYEPYKEGFVQKTGMLLDIAREDILFATDKFPNDFIILDAIRRALERDVRVRVVAEEIDTSVSERFTKAGVEVRLGRCWPKIIVVDSRNGITADSEGKGVFWLNAVTDHKVQFERVWQKAESLRA